MMEDILKFTDTTIIDGSIEEYEYHEYANADEVALTNNAIMHLFSRIEYQLIPVDRIN